jgi:oxygen-independent coproporphyrinogen-3 oxidase
MRSEDIGRIVSAARDRFDVARDAEITLEANPDTVTEAALDGFLRAGVTRLSVGTQSFRDDDLRALGRRHDAAAARQALRLGREAGFEHISLDLMLGLPTQTLARFAESVDEAVDAMPDHVSMYMLELYPHAPLRDEMARHHWAVPPDDEVADMYEVALDRFGEVGLEQYEISNVARAGHESRHNLKYWEDGQWRGAHSTIRGRRWKNVGGPEEYAKKVLNGGQVDIAHRELTREERWQEALITGLRLSRGIEVSAFNRNYGLDLWARYGDHLQPSVEAGLVVFEQDRLWLSRRGMLLANDVLAVFI